MPTDFASLALLAALLLATGIVAGFIAGLLGVGGDIVVVPVLFQIFIAFDFDEGISMLMAVGTSLGAMVPTPLSSVFSSWAPGVVIGVAAGTLLAGLVPGQVLTAARMLWRLLT